MSHIEQLTQDILDIPETATEEERNDLFKECLICHDGTDSSEHASSWAFMPGDSLGRFPIRKLCASRGLYMHACTRVRVYPSFPHASLKTEGWRAADIQDGAAWFREMKDGVVTGRGGVEGGGAGISGMLENFLDAAKTMMQGKGASGQGGTGGVAPRTFTFARDGTDYLVSVTDTKERLGAVMERAANSVVLLRDATKVTYVKKKRGSDVEVEQQILDFRQLEAGIFFDDNAFPYREFDLT